MLLQYSTDRWGRYGKHNQTRAQFYTNVVDVRCFSLLLLLCLGASAFAQALDQKKLDELVRKAETREAADGICARTGRPRGDSVKDFTLVLKRATVDREAPEHFQAAIVSLTASPTCTEKTAASASAILSKPVRKAVPAGTGKQSIVSIKMEYCGIVGTVWARGRG